MSDIYFTRIRQRGNWTTFNVRNEDADEAERRLMVSTSAEPVYDQSVVKRLATQMGWTPPSASPAAQPAADAPMPNKLFGMDVVVDKSLPPGTMELRAAKSADRQGVALSDAEIERIFYPSGGADYLQLQIARNIGRAMERAVLKRASRDLTDDQIKEIAKNADCKWLFNEYTLSMKAFARAILSRASSSRAEVESEGARDQLAALVDIYDDAMNNPPESRTYVDGAFGQQMNEARVWLAAAEAPNEEIGDA